MDAKHLEALAAAMSSTLADDTPNDNLTDTVSSIAEKMYAGKKQIYTAAQKVQDKENKQFVNDLKNFFKSQEGAITHGNTNACNVNHVHQANHQAVSKETKKSTRSVKLPDTARGRMYNVNPSNKNARVTAPKPVSHPRSCGTPRGVSGSLYNQLVAPLNQFHRMARNTTPNLPKRQ
jgi:hypothetical protein